MRALQEFTNQCRSLLETGHYEDVIRLSLERLEKIPDDLESVLFMAEAKLLKGELADAKSLLDPLCPRLLLLSRAYKLLGDVFFTDNPELAKDYYRRYMALDPESEDSAKIQTKLESGSVDGNDNQINTGFRTLTMADLMIRQGHIDTAREILKEILCDNPDDKQALARLEKLQVIRELEKWKKGLLQKANYRE